VFVSLDAQVLLTSFLTIAIAAAVAAAAPLIGQTAAPPLPIATADGAKLEGAWLADGCVSSGSGGHYLSSAR
jgi:hypothetical protein